MVVVRGHYNRQRRMREEMKWAEVIEPMFKAFMIFRTLTREWSHGDTWNRDNRPDCRCSMAKKNIRSLDVYDILSTSYYFFSISYTKSL